MKEIIIFDHKGGRLANQLWLYASVSAFCIEHSFVCRNIGFYPYSQYFYFKMSWLQRVLKALPPKVAKIALKIIQIIIRHIHHSEIISDGGIEFILDKEKNINTEQSQILERMISEKDTKLYLDGWLFRYEDGLERYRSEIHELFSPRQEYQEEIAKIIEPLRKQNKKIIGVHIRHGDYRTWMGGKYFFSFEEVRGILDRHVSTLPNPEACVFLICSDEQIDSTVFEGLSYVHGPGSIVGDLFALAQTDMIIGSTSTFGSWAAYYGNIPFVQFNRT